jgi:hypothetical protein
MNPLPADQPVQSVVEQRPLWGKEAIGELKARFFLPRLMGAHFLKGIG